MEIWKDTPGYEGRYQVSDLGNVRSVDREVRSVSKRGMEYLRKIKGVVLRPGDCRGYLIVNLTPTGTIAVHILVAKVFVPGERRGYDVNHMGGVKTNNRADNLEWVTKSRNQQHAVEAGLKSQAIRVKCPTTGKVYHSINRAARAAGCRARTVSEGWARV